jgi:hypothetical protein
VDCGNEKLLEYCRRRTGWELAPERTPGSRIIVVRRLLSFWIHTRHNGRGQRNGCFDDASVSITEDVAPSADLADPLADPPKPANPQTAFRAPRTGPLVSRPRKRRGSSGESDQPVPNPPRLCAGLATRASSCLIPSARRAHSAAIRSASAFSAARFSSSVLPDRAISMKSATMSGS